MIHDKWYFGDKDTEQKNVRTITMVHVYVEAECKRLSPSPRSLFFFFFALHICNLFTSHPHHVLK